jgi:hypothetical protein
MTCEAPLIEMVELPWVTVSVNVVVPVLFPESRPVIVKSTLDINCVGAPVSAPVDASMETPLGREGEMLKLVIVVPVEVIAFAGNAVPAAVVCDEEAYEKTGFVGGVGN